MSKYDDMRDIIIELVELIRNEHVKFCIEHIINDIESSIESYGVKVYYSEMEGFENPYDISGYSQINDDGEPEIIINIHDSYYRQRFTMAHELGHVILHWGWDNKHRIENPQKQFEVLYRQSHKNIKRNDKYKEFQANEFASELLIPKSKLIESYPEFDKEDTIDQKIKKFNAINTISKVFKVSESFAEVQIKKYFQEIFEAKAK